MKTSKVSFQFMQSSTMPIPTNRKMFEKKIWILSTSTPSRAWVSRVTREINVPGGRLSKYLRERLCRWRKTS